MCIYWQLGYPLLWSALYECSVVSYPSHYLAFSIVFVWAIQVVNNASVGFIWISQMNNEVGRFKKFVAIWMPSVKFLLKTFAHFVNITFSPSFLFIRVHCIEKEPVIKTFLTNKTLVIYIFTIKVELMSALCKHSQKKRKETTSQLSQLV